MEPWTGPSAEHSELERRLLEAARQDHIPSALRARMAEGLGLQLAVTLESSAAAASKVGVPLFAKAGLWGALSVVLGVGVWQLSSPGPAEPAPARTELPPAEAPRNEPTSKGPADEAVIAIASTDTTPEARAATAKPRQAPRDEDAALRSEIALLDRVRSALLAGSSVQALRLLDQHARRFEQARLAPEAAALRIEALVQRGSHEQAEAQLERFVASYPSHPSRARVSALLDHGSPVSRSPR